MNHSYVCYKLLPHAKQVCPRARAFQQEKKKYLLEMTTEIILDSELACSMCLRPVRIPRRSRVSVQLKNHGPSATLGHISIKNKVVNKRGIMSSQNEKMVSHYL